MKIIRLKLTAVQIAVLLLIDKLYDFDSYIEDQIAKIMEKYPGGISNNGQDVFELTIKIDDVEDFLLIIGLAIGDTYLKEIRNNMISFELEVRTLIRNAEIESISNLCRLVVILGDLKLSDELLQKLRRENIEVITAQTAQAVENMVSKKKDSNPSAELLVLLVAAEDSDNRVIEDVNSILVDYAGYDVFVCKMVKNDIPAKIPYPIDMYIKNENEIDFSSLAVDIEEEGGDVKEECEDSYNEDRHYW